MFSVCRQTSQSEQNSSSWKTNSDYGLLQILTPNGWIQQPNRARREPTSSSMSE